MKLRNVLGLRFGIGRISILGFLVFSRGRVALCRKPSCANKFSAQDTTANNTSHRWDENFEKKPAYDAILNAYGGSASTSPSNSNTTTSAPAVSNVATSVSVPLSTGVLANSTSIASSSVAEVEPEATGDGECEVVYLYK